jgi:glyoxylase-like metal-dependent hydrolase (beta-lactamase superfamily II)/rhodanese-related sulfurtransferase
MKQKSNEMEQQEINTNTLREWLDAGRKVTVLDVRPAHEREEWHIPGSIHVDAYDALKNNNPDALKSVELDKSDLVVTVCAGGRASLIAADLLQKAGYESYSLQGGMKSWSLSWNTARVSYDSFEVIQFRRTGKGCLSYLIVSDKEAMVVDASLPIEIYQEAIDQWQVTLKYAADTHIHADHLSRTKKLAETYGLQPSMPSNNNLNYPFIPITDSQTFTVGKIRVKAMHTPGHTLESTSYLVDGKVLLTGDTLFINGVGRPDLKADEEEAKRKARMLYHSLRKLAGLDKSVLIMPGHTSQPVAFDHKAIQASLEEVLWNVSLLNHDEEVFVQSLLKRIPNPPENYLKIVGKNISGDMSDINSVDLEAGANRCAIS